MLLGSWAVAAASTDYYGCRDSGAVEFRLMIPSPRIWGVFVGSLGILMDQNAALLHSVNVG